MTESGAPLRPAAHAEDRRQQHVYAAEVRLLYENAPTGIAVTIVIAALLAYVQWSIISHAVLSGWLLYMALTSMARFVLVRRYWLASPAPADTAPWMTAFVVGTALTAAGWGAGAIALYSTARPTNEVLVLFAVGGMMLGGASLFAGRPAAFLTFLLPTGLVTSLRVASEGDGDHVMMGILGALFTVATVVTSWRFHRAIDSSFTLRFENHDLIDSLRAAKSDTEALNQELELRVRDRTAKLKDEDRRKDEFLATLAHELRNPLAPIRFALESLKTGAPATAAHAREVVERQVAQLVRLVDDLLDVSRITANKIQLRREAVDLAAVMATAVESIAPLAATADHTLDVQLPATAVHVEGDAARLVQVFANVLNNAVKFTPRGGRIWFTAEAASDQVVVTVRDTGMGIAPRLLPRVFEMFQQADSLLDRSTGGLGIGLTLARRLVEMHRGAIAITSPGRGEGTSVEIRLPVAPAPAVAVAAPPASAAPTTAEMRSLRVLIVEDSLDAAEMLGLAVSYLGHVPRLTHDGAAALTAASQFGPDVIFLDIGLPVLNGYEVARTLRGMAEFDHVHIAAVTGWGQDEDRRKARDAGCDSHFTKPLSPETLEQLLTTVAQSGGDGSRGGVPPRTRLGDSSGA